jgi:hypothetical protein
MFDKPYNTLGGKGCGVFQITVRDKKSVTAEPVNSILWQLEIFEWSNAAPTQCETVGRSVFIHYSVFPASLTAGTTGC